MQQTGIKHWRVVRKISGSQRCNQLGTPGWAKSFQRGVQKLSSMSNTFKLCQTHFPGRANEILGRLCPPLVRACLKHKRIFFKLLFFVVSGETSITKKCSEFCVGTFSGKRHRFLKFEKGAGAFLPSLATHGA